MRGRTTLLRDRALGQTDLLTFKSYKLIQTQFKTGFNITITAILLQVVCVKLFNSKSTSKQTVTIFIKLQVLFIPKCSL